jgi:hypothetical protein
VRIQVKVSDVSGAARDEMGPHIGQDKCSPLQAEIQRATSIERLIMQDRMPVSEDPGMGVPVL